MNDLDIIKAIENKDSDNETGYKQIKTDYWFGRMAVTKELLKEINKTNAE